MKYQVFFDCLLACTRLTRSCKTLNVTGGVSPYKDGIPCIVEHILVDFVKEPWTQFYPICALLTVGRCVELSQAAKKIPKEYSHAYQSEGTPFVLLQSTVAVR